MNRKEINEEILLIDRLVVEHEKIILVLKQQRNRLAREMFTISSSDEAKRTQQIESKKLA